MNKVRVLMVGPRRDVKGGISSVVNAYYRSSLVENYALRYIATHVDGTTLDKLCQAIKGLTEYTIALFTFRPNLVHVHFSTGGSTFRKSAIIFLAKVARKPVIIHSHASQFSEFFEEVPRPIRPFIRTVLNCADHFLVVCEYWQREYRQLLKPEVPIEVLYNPVEIPHDAELPREREQGPVRLLFLGRLGQRKGAYLLLEALNRLAQSGVAPFQLRAGGDGEVNTFLETATKYGLNERIQYLGWVTDDAKCRELASADIFVLPSYWEGLPVAILEAMAARLPVISTTVCGIPEAVVDTETGFLVEPGDVEGLTDRLRILIESEEMRRSMGHRGRQFAEEKFALEKVAKHLSSIYDKLVKTGAREGNSEEE